MQDRGSGGCVSGGQGSQSTETRGCPHCGKYKISCGLQLVGGDMGEYHTCFPGAAKLQTHFQHCLGVPGVL